MMQQPTLHEGRQELDGDWSIELPFAMARRLEDGSIVFWHSPKRFTSWINVWNNEDRISADDRLAATKHERATEAFDEREHKSGLVTFYSYRLNEDEGDNRVASFCGHAIDAHGDYVQFAAYFDDEHRLADAGRMFLSLSRPTI